MSLNNDYIDIDIVKVLPSPTGCAICLGNLMTLDGVKKSRPLTHDLITNIFKGFNITVQYILINDLKENTYYARLILQEENALGKNILEIDARPSDCIAIAKQNNAPILIHKDVFKRVENVSHILNKKPKDFDDGFDFKFFGEEEK